MVVEVIKGSHCRELEVMATIPVSWKSKLYWEHLQAEGQQEELSIFPSAIVS